MRDKKRIKRILKLIEDMWNHSPDQRFGQLLINIGVIEDSIRMWSNEDKGFEEYLKEVKKEWIKK